MKREKMATETGKRALKFEEKLEKCTPASIRKLSMEERRGRRMEGRWWGEGRNFSEEKDGRSTS